MRGRIEDYRDVFFNNGDQTPNSVLTVGFSDLVVFDLTLPDDIERDFYVFSQSVGAAVPVPAALPLAATGLALFGWIGWRRRR